MHWIREVNRQIQNMVAEIDEVSGVGLIIRHLACICNRTLCLISIGKECETRDIPRSGLMLTSASLVPGPVRLVKKILEHRRPCKIHGQSVEVYPMSVVPD